MTNLCTFLCIFLHFSIAKYTYGNPINQVQQTAKILSNYLKNKNIKPGWIHTLLFFNYDEKNLYDWSDNNSVQRITDKSELNRYLRNEISSKDWKISTAELQHIKTIIKESNYII